MSKEQILEKSKELEGVLHEWGIGEFIPFHTEVGMLAYYIISKGYHKQVEGEWVNKNGLYVCSVCDKTCPYDAQADDISYWECKYCPNCGAHMKGGTE